MEGPAQPVPPVGPSALVPFASEIGMLVALAAVGALIADGAVASWALGVLLPAIAVLSWGAFVAPRARRRLADPGRLLLELVLFGAASAGLVVLSHWPWAVALVLAYALGFLHRRTEAATLAAGWTS